MRQAVALPYTQILVDMWSVGCIFAEMLGGRPLFKGRDCKSSCQFKEVLVFNTMICRRWSIESNFGYSWYSWWGDLMQSWKWQSKSNIIVVVVQNGCVTYFIFLFRLKSTFVVCPECQKSLLKTCIQMVKWHTNFHWSWISLIFCYSQSHCYWPFEQVIGVRSF